MVDLSRQVLEAQEGPDPFVQRVLEGQICGHDRFLGHFDLAELWRGTRPFVNLVVRDAPKLANFR
jgi:hypothetical protein